jgi:hypothetical protein
MRVVGKPEVIAATVAVCDTNDGAPTSYMMVSLVCMCAVPLQHTILQSACMELERSIVSQSDEQGNQAGSAVCII